MYKLFKTVGQFLLWFCIFFLGLSTLFLVIVTIITGLVELFYFISGEFGKPIGILFISILVLSVLFSLKALEYAN